MITKVSGNEKVVEQQNLHHVGMDRSWVRVLWYSSVVHWHTLGLVVVRHIKPIVDRCELSERYVWCVGAQHWVFDL